MAVSDGFMDMVHSFRRIFFGYDPKKYEKDRNTVDAVEEITGKPITDKEAQDTGLVDDIPVIGDIFENADLYSLNWIISGFVVIIFILLTKD